MSRERGPQFNSDSQPEKKKRGRPSKAELEQRALQEREQIAKGLENEVFDFGTPEKQETKDATVEESKTEAEFSPQPEMPESAEKMVFVQPESVGPTEVESIEKQPEQEGEPDNQEPNPEEPPSPENPEDNQDIKDIQEGIDEILQKSIRGEGTSADIETLKDYFAKTKEALEKKISNLNDEIGELSGDDEEDEEEAENKEEENAEEIEEKEKELEKIQKSLEELNNRKEVFDRAWQTDEAPEIEPEEEPEDDSELAKQARAMDKVRREYVDLLKLKTQMMAQNPELDFSKDLVGRSLEAKADNAERAGDLEEYQRAIKEMGEHYKKMDADGMDLPPMPEQEQGGTELNEGIKRDIREIFQYDFENLELERVKLKESGEGTIEINGKTYDDAEFWREKDKLFKLDEALTKDRWDEETKVSIMEALNSKSEQVAREMLEEEISSPEVLEKGKDFDKLLSLRKEIYKNLTGEDLDKTPESIANEKMFAINKESWEIRKQESKKEAQTENQTETQETETKEEQIQEAKDEIAKAFKQEEVTISEEKEVWEAQEKKIAGEEKQKEKGGIFMAYGGLALYGVMRGVAFIFDRMLNLADIADNPSGWIKKRIADWSDRQQKKFDKHVETYFPEAFARKKLDKEG